MLRFVLILTCLSLAFCIHAHGGIQAGQKTLVVQPPTTNEDGTSLTNLLGLNVETEVAGTWVRFWSQTNGVAASPSPSDRVHFVVQLPQTSGVVRVRCRAFNSWYVESEPSNVATSSFDRPSVPIVLWFGGK